MRGRYPLIRGPCGPRRRQSMGRREEAAVERGVRRLAAQIEHWRKVRPRTCAPMPESLWLSAVDLARTKGVRRAALGLGIDYKSLKRRVDAPTGLSNETQ